MYYNCSKQVAWKKYMKIYKKHLEHFMCFNELPYFSEYRSHFLCIFWAELRRNHFFFFVNLQFLAYKPVRFKVEKIWYI